MIGSVCTAMKNTFINQHGVYLYIFFKKKKYSMFENKIVRDYRDAKVSKENLDKLSTYDINCVINNGISLTSNEQLKTKFGEEIVNLDIENRGYEGTK